jgi:hypothetical protein
MNRLVQRAVALLSVCGVLVCIEGNELYQLEPYWIAFTALSFVVLSFKTVREL